MLTEQQKALWEQLRHTLSRDQAIWFAGYVQGIVQPEGMATTATVTAQKKLRVFFATETGNSKMIAQQLAKQAKEHGWNASPQSVKKIKQAEELQGDEPIIFVTATHGEGEPPETALAFFEMLEQSEASLKGVKYAVLGLGDSSYPQYNQAVRDLDAYMEKLGAERIYARGELDVDFASHYPQWIAGVLSALPSTQPASMPATVETAAPSGKGYSRLEPVVGLVREIIDLNDRGSAKATYHIEIEYDESLAYVPGDVAGIILPHFAEGVDHLTPRLYSIASSPLAHAGNIHLTVALAWHQGENGEIGYGLCSRYLADLKVGDEVKFFIQRNSLFKLPEDERDIIMIGPGTGIAPFRSFVWERAERGASGRNWLFFGEQHQHCDFLYQAEWVDFVETGVLHKIDLAFSRDQEHKIYVQHRLKENASELLEWINGGAVIYVCGAKDPMSRDVEQALLEIFATEKGGHEAAQAFLDQLHDDNRYVKDVY
ncbi:sulfite reductase flavoprotein subunit alpha [Nitrosomonas sp. Nm34]|uniref:diflavin oxidoreductase n=1 Tax=Nitrosomonas sp. Nm34 TaxID=1881055 RepID=UPI0008E2EC54|nr:flavodoxin domain-containing protein [Nitrosomonas sp. Nm34]SFI47346.1 sulfite reductase (NADPH) flavoprotein alpha-component [Nitrosomonas sp. Nm34]